MIDAVVNYYGKIDAPITNKQVLITTGGSEALQIVLSCILDEGDEIIIPEPFYPNYSTFVTLTGATIRPITTTPEENYKFAIRERVEACINEHTRAILFTNPGTPTGTIHSPRKSSGSWPTSPESTTCSSSATRCTASSSTAVRSS